MTTLNFNFAPTVPTTNFEFANPEAMERSNARKEQWVRFYCPAVVIMVSLLYVVHAWLAVA